MHLGTGPTRRVESAWADEFRLSSESPITKSLRRVLFYDDLFFVCFFFVKKKLSSTQRREVEKSPTRFFRATFIRPIIARLVSSETFSK